MNTLRVLVASLGRQQQARLVLLVLLAVATPALWLAFKDYGYDDAYIAQRYAQNLAAGKGFIYNDGEKLFGTPDPGYVVLLAISRTLGFDIPLTSNGIGILAIAAAALLLYRMFESRGMPYWGVTAAFLFLAFPHSYRSLGTTYPLFTALTMGSFLAYDLGRRNILPCVLGIIPPFRPDGVLVAGVIFASDFVKKRRLPIREILIYGAITGGWLLFTVAYFGSPFSHDLAEKQMNARFMGPAFPFIDGVVKFAREYMSQSRLNLLFIPLAGLGLAYVMKNDRRWLPLPVWTLVYCALFLVLGLPGAHWYFAPLVPVLIVLTVLGLRWSSHAIGCWITPSNKKARLGTLATSLFGVALLAAGALVSLNAFRTETWESSRFRVYRHTGEWLAQNVDSKATVGMLETGIMGYYSRLPIIDFSGQMTPAVVAAKPKSQTEAALWAVQHYRPDYVAIIPSWLPGLVASETFKTSYTPVASFTDPDFIYGEVVVYHRTKT